MSTNSQYQAEGNKFVVLVQPQMGLSGEFARHLPLSLLYVASPLKKMGIEVIILDRRIVHNKSWENELLEYIKNKPLWIGFTVMAGFPIVQALEMSKFIKEHSPEIPTVWGGALPTIDPKSCMASKYVDFTVSGSGILETELLTKAIIEKQTKNLDCLKKIPGLGYHLEEKIIYNKPYQGFEPVHYKDLPYEIIKDYSVYGQIGSKENIFPIYSAYGCPYQCSFCVSPMLYKTFSPKWRPVSPNEVADH
ncbi:MAG: cobalamin-dependent protein, partial [Candidatus Riflebacteria bacterium]|nr:cobalamin-dependent protein [Candidatus Riflebacteria bacterium]